MLCSNGSDRLDMESVVAKEPILVDVLELLLKSGKMLLEVL